MGGVSDGQDVSAAVTNPAFIEKNADDGTVYKMFLHDADVASGPILYDNVQRALNTLDTTTGSTEATPGTTYTGAPTGTITTGDNHQSALTKLAKKFSGTASGALGHTHDGTDGQGPAISASVISNVPLIGLFIQGTDLTGVTGGSTNVSTALAGLPASSNNTTVGVVTNTPYNRAILTYASGANTDDEIVDSAGNRVYGRVTYSAGVYTLTYYSTVAGTQTPYSFGSSTDVRWIFQQLFNPLVTTGFPVYSPLSVVPSLNSTADVVDAGASQRGLVTSGTQTFGGLKTFNAGAILSAYFATPKLDVASGGSIAALTYNPIVRLTGSSTTTVQGIASGADGKIINIHNTSSGTLTITHEDAGATAANRFHLPGGTSITVTADNSAEFFYDSSISRWVSKANTSTTGFATTALDNLASTAVNTNFLPSATADLRSIGSATKVWFNSFVKQPKSVSYAVYTDTSYTSAVGFIGGDDVSTSPSGVSITGALSEVNSGNNKMFRYTANSSAADSTATGSIYNETGNKTAGTGNSGDYSIYIGTSSGGTRGKIRLKDGSEGTSGYVWTSTDTTGGGHWAAPSSGGASTALDNLTAVAINTSLLPGTDNTINAGSASKTFAKGYFRNIYSSSDEQIIDVNNRILQDGSGNDPVDWGSVANNVIFGSSPVPKVNGAQDLGTSAKQFGKLYVRRMFDQDGNAVINVAVPAGANRQLIGIDGSSIIADWTSNSIFNIRSNANVSVSTQFDKTNTTLANITSLTANVASSGVYRFRARLFVDSDTVGGDKYAIAGTATATSIIYNINELNNSTGAYVISSRQTALAGSASQSGSTSNYVEIIGTITVNASGTLTVQFAQNAANGTSSVLVGSSFETWKIS